MEPHLPWSSFARGLSDAKRLALGALVCFVLGLAILIIASRFIDTSEPHLYGALNDQIAYINVARNLLANGTLQSNTVLPATLWQHTTRDALYMPGHPASIALSYKLFGFGAFQSILPSLISYLIAMLAVYFIAARFYEPLAGVAASLMFGLFPPVIFFSFTAMSEMTFIALFTVALAVCFYLPRRLQVWLSPLLLVAPFVFRETASFVAVPLGLYFWLDRRAKLWQSLLFVVLSVILLTVIFQSNLSAGRPTLLKAQLFGDWHSVYDDALSQEKATNVNWRQWVQVIPGRAVRQLKAMFINPDFAPAATASNYIVMAAMVFAGFAAVFRRDKFAWFLTALNLVSFLALIVLFSSSGYRGMRFLLFTYALNVAVVGALVVEFCSRIRGLIVTVTASALAAAISVFGLSAYRRVYDLVTTRYSVSRASIGAVATAAYVLVFAAVVVGAVIFWRRRRARPKEKAGPRKRLVLPMGFVPTLAIVTVAALVALSTASGFKAIRFVAAVFTVSVLVLGWLLSKGFVALTEKPATTLTISIPLLLLLVFSLITVRNMYSFFAERDHFDRGFAAALDQIDIDRNRMLVTPFEISTRYRYDHFPVYWAFIPANRPTLEMLAARFDIGALILKDTHPLLKDPRTLADFGFYREQVLVINDLNYVVYKRPPHLRTYANSGLALEIGSQGSAIGGTP